MNALRRNCAALQPAPPMACCSQCWAPSRISPWRASWQTTRRSSSYVAAIHKAMHEGHSL